MNIKHEFSTGLEVKKPGDGQMFVMKGKIGSSWSVQTDGNDHSCMTISVPDRGQVWPVLNAQWTQDVSVEIPGESVSSPTAAPVPQSNRLGLSAAPRPILRAVSDLFLPLKRHQLFDSYDAQELLDTDSFLDSNEYNVDNDGNPFALKIHLDHLSAMKQPGHVPQCYPSNDFSGSDAMRPEQARPVPGGY